MQDFITTAEAADIIKRSPRTLEKWRQLPPAKRRLPFHYDGYRVWYDRADVEQFRDASMKTFSAAAVA